MYVCMYVSEVIWRIKETTRHGFFFYRHLSFLFFFQIKPLHCLKCKFISSTWSGQISDEIVFSSCLWKWNEHFCWIGRGTSVKCLVCIKIDNLRWLDIRSCQSLQDNSNKFVKVKSLQIELWGKFCH